MKYDKQINMQIDVVVMTAVMTVHGESHVWKNNV